MPGRALKNYDSPPGRRNTGTKVAKAITDVWTDAQRDLYWKITRKREQIDTMEREKATLVDDLSVLVQDMSRAGMKSARIARVFKVTPSMVSDLLVRAETVRALREADDQ